MLQVTESIQDNQSPQDVRSYDGTVVLHLDREGFDFYIEAAFNHTPTAMAEILRKADDLGLVVVWDEEDDPELTGTGVRRYCRPTKAFGARRMSAVARQSVMASLAQGVS